MEASRVVRSSSDTQVKLRLDDRSNGLIAYVTIDNPRRHNSMNSLLMQELVGSLARLSAEERLRAVVISGSGDRAFIGGANIVEMQSLKSPAEAMGFIGRIHACCHAIRAVPVPVIARIQGYTFGAGLELAASCDLRIASHAATFGMPEVRLGLPSVVEAALLPKLIGWGRARQLLFLGSTIDAKQAEAWGLVEKVVSPADLDKAVEDWLAEILAGWPRAIRLQKELIRSWEDLPTRAAIEAGISTFGRAYESSEPEDAITAFFTAKETQKSQKRI